MVFSILALAVGVPVLATTTPLLATSTMQMSDESQKKREASEQELKLEKCHLMARAASRTSSELQEQLKDVMVVLHDGQLFLEKRDSVEHHKFAGYFLPFPEKLYDGLVSTINAENMLNWTYVDTETHQWRYGVKIKAREQFTGPMSLVFKSESGEWRVACDEREGFIAVRESDGSWGIYFDKSDNRLADKRNGRPVAEIELIRTPLEEETTEADPQS